MSKSDPNHEQKLQAWQSIDAIFAALNNGKNASFIMVVQNGKLKMTTSFINNSERRDGNG